jgi:hypothetical protein
MRTIINVQQRYIQTLDLRATIASGSEAIASVYGKKYKQQLAAYREVLRTVNQVPAFTTDAESRLFIESMEEFIAAQQLYVDYYSLLEEISERSDSLSSIGNSKMYDISAAYREIEPNLVPLPGFRDREGAALYEHQLEQVLAVQECYMQVLRKRTVIARNDDTLTASRKLDRTLSNGYRLLRKQTDLKPSFSTVERGRDFLGILDGYIEMQELCLQTRDKLRRINDGEKEIGGKDNPYRNIAKAYQRLQKAYKGVGEITNSEDLRRYNRQCDNLLNVQQTFLSALHSPVASETDNSLRRETDIDKIKLVIGIK